MTGSTGCGKALYAGSPPGALESELGDEDSASAWALARSTAGDSTGICAHRRQPDRGHGESTPGQSAGTGDAAGASAWTALTFCHAAEMQPKLAEVIASGSTAS